MIDFHALATPFFDSVRAELDALNGRCDLGALNELAEGRGQRVRFVAPASEMSAMQYESAIDATGKVPTRDNMHDFFNALQWLAFPRTKTAINKGHLQHMAPNGERRCVARDVLTMIDESGIVVACADKDLLALIREFKWRALFVERRDEVVARMRFALMGHGIMEKAMAPFIGLTAKAILLEIDDEVPLDFAAANWLAQDANLSDARMLAPLPLLGIPGWDRRNEDPAFYEDTHHFRPGRRERA